MKTASCDVLAQAIEVQSQQALPAIWKPTAEFEKAIGAE
jgi:hypothetical protein